MHARIVKGKPAPFIELLGPLMGLIVAPYLDARGVEREIERGEELARKIATGDQLAQRVDRLDARGARSTTTADRG